MSAPPILKKKSSKTLRLELMTRVSVQQERVEKMQPNRIFGVQLRHADNLFAAYVIAQTIRDGFVFVAKAIRQSIDDPTEY